MTDDIAPTPHPTNRRIQVLMVEHELTRRKTAEICGCSKGWVDSWLRHPGSPDYRECPDNMVRLLEFELGLRQPSYTDRIRALEARLRKT